MSQDAWDTILGSGEGWGEGFAAFYLHTALAIQLLLKDQNQARLRLSFRSRQNLRSASMKEYADCGPPKNGRALLVPPSPRGVQRQIALQSGQR